MSAKAYIAPPSSSVFEKPYKRAIYIPRIDAMTAPDELTPYIQIVLCGSFSLISLRPSGKGIPMMNAGGASAKSVSAILGGRSRLIYFSTKLWKVNEYKITISDIASNIFSMAFERSSPRLRSAPDAMLPSPLNVSMAKITI